MEQKIRQYIEQLFEAAPHTLETFDAKEELVNNSLERYRDLLTRGFDEQEAYDMVIDSIGDIRELMEELSAPEYQTVEPEADAPHEPQYSYEPPEYTRSDDPWRDFGNNLSDLFKNVGHIVNEATSEAFNPENWSLNFDFGGSMELVNRVSVPLEGCGSIQITYMTDKVELYHSENSMVVVEEFMNRNDPACFARIEKGGGVLSIRNGQRIGQMLLRSKVKIYVPSDFQGEIMVATQSGSISADDGWRLARFSGKSVSGSIRLESVISEQIVLHTTSGSIKVEDLDGNLELHSVSGSIKAEDVIGCGEFKTTSGSIRVEFEDLRGAVLASSVSGGIRLEIPDDAGMELDLSSVSGGIHTDFDRYLNYERRRRAVGTVGEPPFYPVKVRTTSGGIHVND